MPVGESGDNPYPGPDKWGWTETFATALMQETALPRDLAEMIAVFTVLPKSYLTKTDGQYRLKRGALSTDDGLVTLRVTVHGFAGTPVEYNERIRSAFASPAQADPDPDLTLPLLTTGTNEDGVSAPFLTPRDPVAAERQHRLLDNMYRSMKEADQQRPYRLHEDIEAFGQKEPTLHVPMRRRIAEQVDDGSAQIRTVPDLPAITGANRSRARQDLHGINAMNVVFGLDLTALEKGKRPDTRKAGNGVQRTADPTFWAPVMASLLRQAYTNDQHEWHSIAYQAARVATVEMRIIVGANDLRGFHAAVFDSNRVDHRRPALDYGLADRSASDMRAVLRDATTRGVLTEPERAWLSGEGRDPNPIPGESLVDRRDRRDQRLLSTVFPADPDARKALRRVMGEPARNETKKRHVQARTRMVSAAISDGYSHRWNPRVLDGLFAATSIKDDKFAVDVTLTWSQLLERAKGDTAALERFIATRGMHWLAEHKLVDADRGSLGAQFEASSADDVEQTGDGTARLRLRRTPINVRNALRADPVRAVGLMWELADASNHGTLPREVDEHGEPVRDTMANRRWFDDAFPKATRVQRRPSDDPQLPEYSATEELQRARVEFVRQATYVLPRAFQQTLEAAHEVNAWAVKADLYPFSEDLSEAVQTMVEAMRAVRDDTRNLGNLLTVLQTGTGQEEDFGSVCQRFLDRQAEIPLEPSREPRAENDEQGEEGER